VLEKQSLFLLNRLPLPLAHLSLIQLLRQSFFVRNSIEVHRFTQPGPSFDLLPISSLFLAPQFFPLEQQLLRQILYLFIPLHQDFPQSPVRVLEVSVS